MVFGREGPLSLGLPERDSTMISALSTFGDAMPKGTKVEKVYKALVRQGKSKASAARIAQSVTGRSLATGKRPKKKKKAARKRRKK